MTESELREVLGQKVFKTAIVLAFPDELDSLVAPSDELDWLAGDERVLQPGWTHVSHQKQAHKVLAICTAKCGLK